VWKGKVIRGKFFTGPNERQLVLDAVVFISEEEKTVLLLVRLVEDDESSCGLRAVGWWYGERSTDYPSKASPLT